MSEDQNFDLLPAYIKLQFVCGHQNNKKVKWPITVRDGAFVRPFVQCVECGVGLRIDV